MLVPAQLYADEVKKKLIECWYKPEYQYYFGGGYQTTDIPDNALWSRKFACVADGEVIGYFAYDYNDADRCMHNFGLISFKRSGVLMVQVLRHIEHMFATGARKLEFYAFADNPANELYTTLVKRHHGRKVGILYSTAFFNGKYHNSYIYEIMNPLAVPKYECIDAKEKAETRALCLLRDLPEMSQYGISTASIQSVAHNAILELLSGLDVDSKIIELYKKTLMCTKEG